MMTTAKPTKSQLQSLRDLYALGGAVLTSEWTTGSFSRHISRRVVPICSRRIERHPDLPRAKLPRRIAKVFEAHPRCQAVIAITDMRTAKRVLKAAGMI
jgi:hypothetical protein